MLTPPRGQYIQIKAFRFYEKSNIQEKISTVFTYLVEIDLATYLPTYLLHLSKKVRREKKCLPKKKNEIKVIAIKSERKLLKISYVNMFFFLIQEKNLSLSLTHTFKQNESCFWKGTLHTDKSSKIQTPIVLIKKEMSTDSTYLPSYTWVRKYGKMKIKFDQFLSNQSN